MDTFDVYSFIKDYPGLSVDKSTNKVICAYNGHEMPCTETGIFSFISGKKYIKLRERHNSELLVKYSEHLVPSIKKSTKLQLFCRLTLRHLNNQPNHIERHVNGRRFQKALARWEECKKTGKKFVPREGNIRKNQVSESDSVNSSNSMFGKMNIGSDTDTTKLELDDDDMEDLYPLADFASGNDSADNSDYEFQNMDDDTETKENEGSSPKSKVGTKRKNKISSSAVPKKKLKATTNVTNMSKKHKMKTKKMKQKE